MRGRNNLRIIEAGVAIFCSRVLPGDHEYRETLLGEEFDQ
jgi:hypothetical protein